MNSQTSSDGIALQPAYGPISNVTIRRNLIRNHQNPVATTPAKPYDGVTPAVDNITFANNWVTTDDQLVLGYMVLSDSSADVQVTDNVLHGDRMADQAGVYFRNVSKGTVARNMILYSNGGVQVLGTSDKISLLDNNYWTHNIWYGWWLNIGPQVTNFTESGDVHMADDSIDTTPPTASFGIADGSIISSPTQITVTASDSGSGVARVYFFVDGVPQGFSDTAPYVFAFDPGRYTAGPHELGALAVDQSANLSTDSHVSVQDDRRRR